MQKYILKRKKYTYMREISRNITSSPVCLLKNLELDHLCVLHNETLQAATESFLHRYKMRNSESYWTLHFLSGMAHMHLPQGVLPLRHTGEIRSAQWLQLCTPRHSVMQAAALSLVCSIKQQKALLKTSNMIMIGTELLYSRTGKKKPQTIILRCFSTYCLFFALSLQNEKEKHRDFPNNVSGKYVCLILLNISEFSYIKHSLYSRLPFILSVYFSKNKFRC